MQDLREMLTNTMRNTISKTEKSIITICKTKLTETVFVCTGIYVIRFAEQIGVRCAAGLKGVKQMRFVTLSGLILSDVHGIILRAFIQHILHLTNTDFTRFYVPPQGGGTEIL